MTAGSGRRIYLSTGEASGDLHGAALVSALRRRFPEAAIEATGGPCLASAGAVTRHSILRCGAMGLAEIVRAIPHHGAMLSDLTRRFRAGAYDLLVVIDYPGFNLKLAGAATTAGVPVLYYIAPQMWAWGSGRAATLRQRAKEVAVILPFE